MTTLPALCNLSRIAGLAHSRRQTQVTRLHFNPVERSLLACLSNDRSVTLYDVSTGSAMQKVTMQTRQNALCWNPMEPFHFTTASEDHDLYTFDMRRLDHAICVHKVHRA